MISFLSFPRKRESKKIIVRWIPDQVRNDNNGYIALMSAIVIGLILTAITFSLSSSGFFLRFNILSNENKKVSEGLAEACVQAAMNKLAANDSYLPASGGECINVGDNCLDTNRKKVCKICSVTTAGSQKTVKARAVYNSSYTNLIATVTKGSTNFTVNSWDENATYSGAPCPIP